METLIRELEEVIARGAFSGVVRIDRGAEVLSVIANTAGGAWPVTYFLEERLAILTG